MKNVPDLVQLNMEKKEILMPSSFIDVGTKTKQSLVILIMKVI